ncbi:MAG TPA: Crp/Fnr family transcriptional regulator [Pyrinomonadaceae bacterium]|nr:Crp/Fnr family transcriptional regulator [Pyrinomonadaceae bacterium]
MLATKLRRSSTETGESNNHAENRLLAALSRKDFRLLLPDFELVALPLNEILYRCGDVIRYVYFPVDSVVSLLSEVENDRSTLEVGVVGNEGMAGIAVFLGVKKSRHQMIVQGAGVALRMKAADLRKHANGNNRLQFLLQLYTHALLTQVSQSAACNRFHLVEARLARWLMAMRDRIGLNEFQLTQEFLSNMLGVRREMVNKAAGTLQKQGLITYTRGVLTILDNAGLEAASCDCYRSIKEEYDNFLD